MRKFLIAGNWKMNKLTNEAKKLAEDIVKGIKDEKEVDVVLIPPFTALYIVSSVISNTNIFLGAQNVFWEKEGAYTGEISPLMLLDLGCKFVIIGHSERREYLNETDEMINKKIKTALNFNLYPILCIGETEEEREAGKTFDKIKMQLENDLKNISNIENLIIAYEPIWAIGTGKTALPEQAQEVHFFIRDWIKDKYGKELANSLRILYGGSVKPANIYSLLVEPDIDGALIGGASLKAKDFIEIVRIACKVQKKR